MAQKKSFEDNINELEKIISDLESGEAPLEECIKMFEKGVKLSDDCLKMINAAQGRITLLTEEGESDIDISDTQNNG